MQNKYGYNQSNMRIEEKMIPTAISFLKQHYPKSEIEIIESYTRDNKTNKYLQDNHVDIIVHLGYKDIYVDLKCTDQREYRFLTFELLRVNRANNIVREGWTEIVNIYPKEDQYVLFVSHTECVLVQKIKFHKCKKDNPSQFNTNYISWWQDKGHSQLYKKNKLLYLTKSEDLELLEYMEAEIYKGSINEGWTDVSFNYYEYI